MFLSRITVHAAAWVAVVLAWSPFAGSVAAEGKAPEVSTVGTTPAILTAAEHAKVAHLAHLARLAHVSATAKAMPVRSIARELLSPLPPVETRIPSTGARDRTKPIPATAAVGKGDGR
jgi:hypothetical protein